MKAFLEQGDPFPGRFVKSKSFRFIFCGTLLGSLVLSNAFKSENVYNIVLPQKPLPFSTMEQLLQHGYKLYAPAVQVQHLLFQLDRRQLLLPTKWVFKVDAFRVMNTENKYIFDAITEIVSYKMGFMQSPSNSEEDTKTFEFLYLNTEPHHGLYQVMLERFDILKPLLQVGLISLHEFQNLVGTSDLTAGQNELMINELIKCNKTA